MKQEKIRQDLENGAYLIDVRSAEEVAQGRICESQHIPHHEILQKGLDVAKDVPIYLFCQKGPRADLVKKSLEEAGHVQVVNLGGVADLLELGFTYQSN